MIVKMNKLTLLCTWAEQENTLEKLRGLGVLHVEHVQPPEGSDLEQARNHHLYVQRALQVLKSRSGEEPTGKDAAKLVDHVWQLIHREKELREELQALIHEKDRIEPFGQFDPRQIKKLAENSIHTQLYAIPAKTDTNIPGFVSICEISRDKNTVYTAAFSRHDIHLSAPKVRMPERSLSYIVRHIETTRAAIEANELELEKYAGDRDIVAGIAQEAEDRVTYLEVQSGMGSAASACYLHGFFPADTEDTIKQAAEESGWGYVIEEIGPDDNPPTLLRNPKWISPIKAVFSMIGVIPGYRELDISALFLIFLSIFFAFLIGDAGYGLLFIGLTLFGKFKTKGKPAAQPALNLLLLMSSFCVVFGVLTGNYFGIVIDALPVPLRSLSNDYMTGRMADGSWNSDNAANHVMFICFAIGTLHLTLAHGWNLIRKINSWAALTDLGWLCSTWALFSVVLNMVLYIELPGWVAAAQLPLLGTGVALIITSLVLTKSYFGLVTLLLDVINNFVDIISYVRLYAVGAASLAIAQAFNGMAMDIGFSGLGSIGAALILFAGHGLNIILGAMGVMVHGIRLNTLEFSGHAGVEWAGIHFNPFRKKEDDL